LEPVAYFNEAMPTAVTVSHQGRTFVNFPKWVDEVVVRVAEIRDGKTVSYPDEAINQSNTDDPSAALVS
jgi:sugar lactone lactonase YvrE